MVILLAAVFKMKEPRVRIRCKKRGSEEDYFAPASGCKPLPEWR